MSLSLGRDPLAQARIWKFAHSSGLLPHLKEDKFRVLQTLPPPSRNLKCNSLILTSVNIGVRFVSNFTSSLRDLLQP
ncbi:hypothetical protein Lal_00039279 [Lupinus albus]|nr:hypothetical protein Lal_00039279 [Lupinus albus]